MYNIKVCKIIYGYIPNCLDNQDSPVLLIEPRLNYIDLIKKQMTKNIILIPKILEAEKSRREITMYYDDKLGEGKEKNLNPMYMMNLDNNIKYKRCIAYSINLEDIILQYKIQNVTSFIININVDNCNELLNSIIPYNHIFSKIIINNDVGVFNKEVQILAKFYTNVSNSDTFTFIHKNLNIQLPKIGMFLFGNLENKNLNNLEFFMHQYKINILINKELSQSVPLTFNNQSSMCKNKILISYPESIEILNQNDSLSKENWTIENKNLSKIYYENVIQNLDEIFIKKENTLEQMKIDELDIIMQFNDKYFHSKNTLQIMYPLKDNVIYVNKQYDIMYSTKNCMYMLYQIIKSTYFSDYINSKNKNLLKIFAKRWFYEYISTIFTIEEF
jgi:hypothetical protein